MTISYMSFRLVPKSVTLDGFMAVTSLNLVNLCSNRVDLWLAKFMHYFVVCVRCRRSRSLSHRLMSFL